MKALHDATPRAATDFTSAMTEKDILRLISELQPGHDWVQFHCPHKKNRKEKEREASAEDAHGEGQQCPCALLLELVNRPQPFPIAAPNLGFLCLASALFLMAIPAQRTFVFQRQLQFIQVHVPKLEEPVLLVEYSQAAAAPICGRQCTAADGACLALIPFAEQALNVLWRGIDLRQAFLTAGAFLRPEGTGFQAGLRMIPESGLQRELAVHLHVGVLTGVRAHNGAAPAITEVGAQFNRQRQTRYKACSKQEENDRKNRELQERSWHRRVNPLQWDPTLFF
jgi:hypothetical protein